MELRVKVTYNMFMNGVDQMDQLRSTNITQCHEKRLYMTMFTMCLDLTVHQAFCLYNSMLPNKANRKHQTLLSFKQQVAQFLVEPEQKEEWTANVILWQYYLQPVKQERT
jgi:hypothetical protein